MDYQEAHDKAIAAAPVYLRGPMKKDATFFPHNVNSAKDKAYVDILYNSRDDSVPVTAYGQKARDLYNKGYKGKIISLQGSLHQDNYGKPYVVIELLRIDGVDEISKETHKPTPTWNMKSAYEANKKSTHCVVCGKELSAHPSVGVLYCKCVENLS
jgi:hypothetical protein